MYTHFFYFEFGTPNQRGFESGYLGHKVATLIIEPHSIGYFLFYLIIMEEIKQGSIKLETKKILQSEYEKITSNILQ